MRRTSDIKAATALAVFDATGNQMETARRTELPPSTVHDIIHGNRSWGEYVRGPVGRSMRDDQKGRLAAASRVLAAKCLSHAANKLENASAYQAVGMYSLLRQYERLDMNESTENVALVARVDATNADQLAARLSRRLVKPV